MRAIAISWLILVGACTPADYFPESEITVIDGEDFVVRPLSSPNSFQAFTNTPSGGELWVIRPQRYIQNVKAIEAATGCAVIRESIVNTGNNTIAAVDCGT